MPDQTAEPGHRRRFFTKAEHDALYLAADGRCEECGGLLEPGWHGDHVTPYSDGGRTDVVNGQALCPVCNMKKGTRQAMKLRTWQQEALNTIAPLAKKDYLIEATPGAGKTVFGITL